MKGYLSELVKEILASLDDLGDNAMECDENGDCIAETKEFSELLETMDKFIGNFK